MSYQDNNEYENLVSLFWNTEKTYQEDIQTPLFTLNNYCQKTIPLGKYFVSDESNNTKSTTVSNNNLTVDALATTLHVAEPAKKKVFLIKKYVKYEEIIKEFCGEDEISDSEKKTKKSKVNSGKRIKLIKYNNKKLSNLEKVEKLKILSKVVRRYRRKIKNIRKKIKVNSEKIWAKYLNKKMIKDKKNKKEKEKEKPMCLGNLMIALKKLRSFPFEYDQDRLAVENLVNLISSGKLKPDSINYQIIATQVRAFLEEDKIRHLVKDPKIYINFPEKEVFITKKELEFYKNAGTDENVFRTILGFKKEYVQENKGIYDHVLARMMNKNVDADEFCNNLFNTDIANCNNVFIK